MFTGYVKFRLLLYISVIHLLFPSAFRDKLWVGLYLGVGTGLVKHFQTGVLFQICLRGVTIPSCHDTILV